MARETGMSSTTYTNLILDSGAIYAGWTDFTTKGTLLGATRGGSSVKIETEYREMEADGARGKVVGSRRIVRVEAQLTANFLEHSLAQFIRALPAATSSVFDTDWDQIIRDAQIADSDFLSNIVFVGKVSGKDDAIGFKFDNCLADGAVELTLADKEEGILPITFSAHFTTADLDTEPWSILYPKA